MADPRPTRRMVVRACHGLDRCCYWEARAAVGGVWAARIAG